MTEQINRRLCWTTDVQGYGRGNDVEQAAVQKELRELLDEAATAAGLNRRSWERQEAGDGELAIVSADEPENLVVGRFTTELAALLYRRNCVVTADKKLKVRIAADHGIVRSAAMGYVGDPVVAVSRLVGCAAGRAALNNIADANLVMMLSQQVYKDLVQRGHVLQPAMFLRVPVKEKEYTQDAWLFVPGVDMATVRHAMAKFDDIAHTTGDDLSALSPELQRLRSVLGDWRADDPDLAHTLDVFRKLVRLVNRNSPLSAYGDAAHAAFAYVLAEASIVHGHTAPTGADGEFTIAARIKRDLDLLAPAARDIDDADIATMRRCMDHVSLADPGKIKSMAGLRSSPAARCFSLLWGVSQLALLLDNPYLVDAELLLAAESKRRVIDVVVDTHDGSVDIELATKGRRGFHLAAEAHHSVRRYLAELEDLWRRSHLISPTMRFEISTPNWLGRSVEVHEIRVDPRPITQLLMGRALYGDRPHVWLRELLQNAVDATGLGGQGDANYRPRIDVILENPHTVVIRDNGIGMTKQQVLTQLSVLGRSGWRNTTSEVPVDGTVFFGRFGIGFASVFSVASALSVLTRTVDAEPTNGIAVRFSGPERPFYTDMASCPVGTEIRVTLIEPMSTTNFREAFADLFAYLLPGIHVSPDLQMPTSLHDFSSLTRNKNYRGEWSVLEQTGTAQVGTHQVGFKVEILHDPAQRKSKSKKGYSSPRFSEIGYTATTICVDGVRVSHQYGLRPTGIVNNGRALTYAPDRDLHLWGCYLTVDFGRDDAPLMASRNSLDIDDELQRQLERLVLGQVAEALPELAVAAQATCLSNHARHDAVFGVLSHLLHAENRFRFENQRFHENPEVNDAAAATYRAYCPVRVMAQGGRNDYRPIETVDPDVCSVAVTESLTAHAMFPAFARARSLTEWLVAADKRELHLLANAWPYDTPLRTVDEATQLYEDFQTVLPEVREGLFWRLLRADYGLSEGAVFNSRLRILVPGRKGAVTRDVGLARRRFETSPTERPRVMLNRDHELVRAIESYLERADDGGTGQMQDWLARFCKDILDERRQRVISVMLPGLLDQFTAITGVTIALSPTDLRD